MLLPGMHLPADHAIHIDATVPRGVAVATASAVFADCVSCCCSCSLLFLLHLQSHSCLRLPDGCSDLIGHCGPQEGAQAAVLKVFAT
jgi:hypothetical protein